MMHGRKIIKKSSKNEFIVHRQHVFLHNKHQMVKAVIYYNRSRNNTAAIYGQKLQIIYFKLALYRVIIVLLTVCLTEAIVNRLSKSVAPYLVGRQLRKS
jgi:hypothetical protein